MTTVIDSDISGTTYGDLVAAGMTKVSNSPDVKKVEADKDVINLYRLGMLFVVRCRYWSFRIKNTPEELGLNDEAVRVRAFASFGTKDLLDPKVRKVFQQIEGKARSFLAKHSRPFAAANAHFVPWNHVKSVIEGLEALNQEFALAVQDLRGNYHHLKQAWLKKHPPLVDYAYPSESELLTKFSLSWSAFKVTGAPQQMASIEDIDKALEHRRIQAEQIQLMEDHLRQECQQFVRQYVVSFRREVAEFCDEVVKQKGRVHGRTLQAIRRKIDHFQGMNVFGDDDAAQKLRKLKEQIAGLTGQELTQQPDVADMLSRACQSLKNYILDPGNVSQLTGRLKRRVVLD